MLKLLLLESARYVPAEFTCSNNEVLAMLGNGADGAENPEVYNADLVTRTLVM